MPCAIQPNPVKEYKLMLLHACPDNQHGLPCTNAMAKPGAGASARRNNLIALILVTVSRVVQRICPQKSPWQRIVPWALFFALAVTNAALGAQGCVAPYGSRHSYIGPCHSRDSELSIGPTRSSSSYCCH
jgi:hypothetical protein